MTRLPIVDAQTMERVVLRLGFAAVGQKGSHAFYRHPDGRATTIPFHGSRDLSHPLIRATLREIDLAPDDFADLLSLI
jgi:predicted RNA binding protein YcfA (HicA-like mRNA interferase family)